MRLLFSALILLVCAGIIIAQNQESINSENQRALILDQTTPEEVIKMFGPPTKNKVDKLEIQKIDKWVTSKRNEKIFEVLSFDQLTGFDKIELAFLDNKLILIHYVLDKRLLARDLAQIYKIAFVPILNDLGNFRPSDYEQEIKGNISITNYPNVYYLVAVSKIGLISARVTTDNAYGDSRLDRNKIERANRIRPLQGKVTEIQIISRKLLI